MTSRSADRRAAAHDYLARGWSVIPLLAREKRPLLPWAEFQQRPPTRQEIDAWFQRWPDANVGVVTGAGSGLVVLDIDVRHGGTQSLARLESECGSLPHTVEALTGGGGRHLYFAHPGGVVHNRVGLEPGIDVRGDGGYIVAPPSVHPSGKRYAWVAARSPGEAPLAPLPPTLLERLVARAGTGHPLAHWRQLVVEWVDEGERNNSLASLAGHLLWRGVDPVVALELLLCWNARRCRPPLADDEVAQIVDSIARLHLRQREGA
jgi:hypothetical protein